MSKQRDYLPCLSTKTDINQPSVFLPSSILSRLWSKIKSFGNKLCRLFKRKTKADKTITFPKPNYPAPKVTQIVLGTIKNPNSEEDEQLVVLEVEISKGEGQTSTQNLLEALLPLEENAQSFQGEEDPLLKKITHLPPSNRLH